MTTTTRSARTPACTTTPRSSWSRRSSWRSMRRSPPRRRAHGPTPTRHSAGVAASTADKHAAPATAAPPSRRRRPWEPPARARRSRPALVTRGDCPRWHRAVDAQPLKMWYDCTVSPNREWGSARRPAWRLRARMREFRVYGCWSLTAPQSVRDISPSRLHARLQLSPLFNNRVATVPKGGRGAGAPPTRVTRPRRVRGACA